MSIPDLWFVDYLKLKLQADSESVNGTKSPVGFSISQTRTENKTYGLHIALEACFVLKPTFPNWSSILLINI